MKKKYGLLTAIAMVVGIVIGSGVFFKTQDILGYTGGNMLLGALAWIIGGVIMLLCMYTFATMATMYEKVNGVVDYSEALVGEGYAYSVGWFFATVYYPTLVSVLAWISAKYTLLLFGSENASGGLCLSLAGLYLVSAFILNALLPRAAGKFQISATVIKLIPLVLMSVVGTAFGLAGGKMAENLSQPMPEAGINAPLFAAVVATSFAYEGWVIATSINSEIRDAKKNLPRALMLGGTVIIAVCVFYFIGLCGGADASELLSRGTTSAFTNIFGNGFGTVLKAFVVVSCLGTLNGLTLGCSRGLYSVAVRKKGPKPEMFGAVDKTTDTPVNSAMAGLFFSAVWLFYFYASNIHTPLFGVFSFDSSELPVVTVYAMYIPIFVMFIVKNHRRGAFRYVVMPILAIAAAGAMVLFAVYSHGIAKYLAAREAGYFACPIVFYLIVFAAVMALGAVFMRRRSK